MRGGCMSNRAVVLLSGGLDSTTALSQAVVDGATHVLAVTARYGSRHSEAESLAAIRVFEWMRHYRLDVEFDRVSVVIPDDIFKGGGSALLGESDMPHLSYKEIGEHEGPSPTVVPFRNANFISIAASIAEARSYDSIYIGVHAEDAHNWAYPDCTPEFIGSMAAAVYVGTYHKVRLVAPFLWMDKAGVVLRAAQLGAPLHLTWSCYNPKQKLGAYVPCGLCPTCVERQVAFYSAGYLDPGLSIPGDASPDVNGLLEWPVGG